MLRLRAFLHGSIGLLLLVAILHEARAQEPDDAIIARVNGQAVLLSELKEAALDQDVPPSALLLQGVRNPAYRKALTQIVDEVLLMQQAKTDGLKTNDMSIASDVDQMIHELRRQMGSPEKLDAFLKEHHLTLDSLRAVMTEREKKRSQTAEVVARRVVVDDGVVEQFRRDCQAKGESAEAVNLSQILVACSPAARASKGADFRRQAMKAAREAGTLKLDDLPGFVRRYEEVSTGVARGITLGWLDPATLLPALREQVAKMKPGDVSQPIETEQGYHVLVLLGRHNARDLAYAREFAKARERLLLQLRRQASIQIYDLEGHQIKLDLSETTPTLKQD